MRIPYSSKIAGLGAIAVLTVAGAAPAMAQPFGGQMAPVVGCDAPGNKQAGGAILGALLGGVAGSNLAKNDRGTGTAIGAVVGAAAGSTIGCKMQRGDQARAGSAYDNSYGAQSATYVSRGYRLSSSVSPAAFVRDGGALVATTNVNLRAAPTTGSPRVSQLRAGERFQALARVRGSDWVLVGENGVGIGYVHSAYVQPETYGRYAYR